MMRLHIWISRSSLRDEGIWDLVFGICRACDGGFYEGFGI